MLGPRVRIAREPAPPRPPRKSSSMLPTVSGSRPRWIASAFLICALLWFAGLEYRGLFMPDEGRYADIGREMLDSSDWVTPRHNGIKYLEKPPLQYWATAGAFALFGADEWTARLWPALTGFLGILLAAFALLVYVVIERDWALLRRLHWAPGLAVFGAIVLPWFVLVQHRNPEFFHFFFIREHFERYLLPHHHRPGPWWYFAPVLLVALLPWTPSIPAALARGWKASASSGFKPDRFLVIWTAIVVLFFSASQSKLPGYVLPALPAILLLFARHYPAMSDGVRRAPALACVAGGVVLALLAGALPTLSAHLSWTEFDAGYSIWLFAAALALAAAGIAALGLLRRTRREASIAVLGLGSLLAAQLALSGAHVLDENYSSERLIKPVAGRELRFPRDAPFYSVATFDQSVPFYLGRPVTLVGYRDELAPGIASEPGKYVGSVDEFVSRWQEHGEAFAIMEPPLYEKLRARGLSGRVLARDTRQIILARR